MTIATLLVTCILGVWDGDDDDDDDDDGSNNKIKLFIWIDYAWKMQLYFCLVQMPSMSVTVTANQGRAAESHSDV